MKKNKNLFLLFAVCSLIFTGCGPTSQPSSPTVDPTSTPTSTPSVSVPTVDPTVDPTSEPTIPPTVVPTTDPTVPPTSEPTSTPTTSPTTSVDPTSQPTSTQITSPTTSEDPTTSSPTTTEDVPVNLYEKALENTTTYSLKSTTSDRFYEIVQDGFYYSSPMFAGYVVPDTDSNYYHQYSIKSVSEGNSHYETMEVYGRTFRKSDVNNYVNFRMYDILYYCASAFVQIPNTNTYSSTNRDLSPIFEEFFQSKLIGACNYFEVDIDKDYRFSQIRFYEYYASSDTLILNQACRFTTDDHTSAPFYQKWVETGKEINLRIRDIKSLVPSSYNPSIPTTLYEGETVTIDVTVTSIDSKNSFYVTQNDERAGPIGLEVKYGKLVTDLEIGENITITGKVKTEINTDINTYLYDVTYEKKGTKESFPPAYDEDYMVDTYGGGTYAGVMFANNLIYGGSLYSTYAYVLDMPSSLELILDTVITLICPNIVDLNGQYFVLDLVIPSSLDKTTKEEIFNSLKAAGEYSLDTVAIEAKELSLENFIIDYNFAASTHTSNRGTYPVSLLATNSSTVSNKLSLAEKMEKYFNLSDFPILSDKNASYKFGGASGLFIEEVYGDYKNKDKTGLFVSYTGVTEAIFEQYQSTIVSYGFTKFDEIKDTSRERHYIYTLGDVVLDFSLSLTDYTLLCWAYTKPMVMKKSIEDQLKDAIGSWFDVDKYFARLSGTTDADYTLFQLPNYAGTEYSNSPLTVVAIDLQTNRYSEYLSELVRNLSYKQYRNPETNRPASYKIRGVNHQGIYQADEDIFIDMAVYSTTDYTYAGHDQWQYRIELVFLNSNAPMKVDTYNNLDVLTDLVKQENEIAYFNPSLPSDAVVEYWLIGNVSILDRDVYYGFGSRNEAYVYTSSVEDCYDAIVTSLLDAGYQQWGSTTNVYVIHDGDNSYLITLLKEVDRGFVRVIQGAGGYDFWRS